MIIESLGIDPGKTGAMAYISRERAVLIVPFEGMLESDIIGAVDCIPFYTSNHIERVASRPKDDPYTAFTFGAAYGFIRGVLGRNGYELVEPKTWQFEFNLGGRQGPSGCSTSQEYAARKRNACAKAKELFPGVKGITQKTADAVLIAEYGFRKANGLLTNGKTIGVKREARGLLGER